MDAPTITREVRDEAERRLTGGPDPVAAYELIPPDQRGKIEEDPAGAVETLWSSWLDMTAKLQSFGFTARTLCDASNIVAEVWTEKTRAGERQHA